jgi:hypothetical protein
MLMENGRIQMLLENGRIHASIANDNEDPRGLLHKSFANRLKILARAA